MNSKHFFNSYTAFGFRSIAKGRLIMVQIGTSDLYVKVTKKNFWQTMSSDKSKRINGFTMEDKQEYIWVTNLNSI